MKLFSLFTLAISLSTPFAHAEIAIKTWIAAGTKDCRKDKIQVIGNGNAFSILFNQFGPDLQTNDRQGYADVSACHVAVLLELPKNTCIQQMDQLLSGGVIKSKNSNGQFFSVTRLNGINPIINQTRFALGDEILPEDADSILFYQASQATRCVYTKYQWYTLDMLFTATRRTKSDIFIGNIDSSDGEVVVRMR